MTSRKWMGTIVAIALVSFASHALAQGGSGGGGSGGGGGGGTAAVGESADLQLTGSASTNSPEAGSVYSYTFQIKNSGGSTATGVFFADPVPAGTTPNYATLNGSTLPCAGFGDGADGTQGTMMRCNIGSLAKGASATVVVSLNAPQVGATIANSGAVGATTTDPKLTNNFATVNVTVKAPTGGVCKGGVCDSVPTATAATCAVLTSVSAPVGYYSTFAAVWNTFTVQSCSTSVETITIDVVETDVADGSVDYTSTYAVSLNPSQNLGIVLDNDFAPFDTTYDVSYTVKDGQGNLLSNSTVRVTTPSPQP